MSKFCPIQTTVLTIQLKIDDIVFASHPIITPIPFVNCSIEGVARFTISINHAIQFRIVSKSDHALTSPVLDIPIISLDSIQRESDNVDQSPAIVVDCLIIIPLNFPPSAVRFTNAFCISGNQTFQASTIFFTSLSATQNTFASSWTIGIPRPWS